MDTYGSTAAPGEGHPRGDQPGRGAASPSVGTPLPPPADAPDPATAKPPVPLHADAALVPLHADAALVPLPADAALVPLHADAAANPTSEGARPSHLFGYLAVYTLLRLALVAVLTAVLTIFMPLIVGVLFAIIIQLPLSWLLFAGPRRRVNEAMARSAAQRRAERNRLQAALSGEQPPG
jgi:hypothetical protein